MNITIIYIGYSMSIQHGTYCLKQDKYFDELLILVLQFRPEFGCNPGLVSIKNTTKLFELEQKLQYGFLNNFVKLNMKKK
ncbi:hypothetical protein BpHYR1_051088 [Brachionus plicatilis]|uniref:Uncharacterized protein n=1 Tax=Brachionus plicatilis TaxID=10195 RepID=A0A3M7PIX7_BRAPC|nr:hypothetical protein BpHYR1_051088 [Brachionus plicatilis]